MNTGTYDKDKSVFFEKEDMVVIRSSLKFAQAYWSERMTENDYSDEYTEQDHKAIIDHLSYILDKVELIISVSESPETFSGEIN